MVVEVPSLGGSAAVSAAPSTVRWLRPFLPVLIAGSLLSIGVWSQTRGLGPDSVTYLDAARSIADGDGLSHRFAYWDPVYAEAVLPTRSTMWPPGLPMAIAAGMLAGLDPLVAGRIVTFISFIAILLMLAAWGRWTGSTATGSIAAGAACGAIAVTPSPDGTIIASELPFLCFATGSAMCAIRAFRAEAHPLVWLTTASALAGFAFAFRYVGLASVGASVVVALFMLCARPLSPAGIVGSQLPGVLIVSSVFVRNALTAGTLGQPWPGADIFWSTLPGAVTAAAGALLRADLLTGSWRVLVILKLIVLITLSGLTLDALRSAMKDPTQAREQDGLRATGILLLYTLAVAGVTVAATAANGMILEARYLLVVAPWLFLVIATWALGNRRRAARITAWVGCALWIGTEVLVARFVMAGHFANAIDRGARSPAIAWARTYASPTETLLTNRGADLAFWTPNRVARLPRLPHSGYRVMTLESLDGLADRLGARYLIHFRGYPSDSKYDATEFEFARRFDSPDPFRGRVVADFPEAIVYRVGSKWTSRP